MGLHERRKIQELQTTTVPERQREIAEICGREIAYDFDWSSFDNDAAALNFVDNCACHRLNMALRTICIDDLGRQAVREGLKSVRVLNVQDAAQRALRFDDGVLTLAAPWGRGAEALHRDADIRDALLARL
jgi:hypothetical protein